MTNFMIKALGSEMVLNLTLDFVPNLFIRIDTNCANKQDKTGLPNLWCSI